MGGPRRPPGPPLIAFVTLLTVLRCSSAQAINECEYKEISEGGRKPLLVWTCTPPKDDEAGRVVRDCCPGYSRSELFDNACIVVDKTYEPIITTLEDMEKPSTALSLNDKSGDIDLTEKDSPTPYTVFIPQTDSDIDKAENGYDDEPDGIKMIITPGRHYAGEFKYGKKLPAANGMPLKVMNTPSGLTLIECQLLIKPDQEAQNGLIHTLSGPIKSTKRYPTVLSRLSGDSRFSEFVADIPGELKQQLDNPNSADSYTVFAPTNDVWRRAKQSVSDPKVTEQLVQSHVTKSLLCASAMESDPKVVGRRLDGSKLKIKNKQPVDECNSPIDMSEKDLMAGNGVVHVIRNAMVPLAAMDLPAALDCLSKNEEVSRTAAEMKRCNPRLPQGKPNVVLIPLNSARKAQGDQCQAYSHHLLTAVDCPSYNIKKPGFQQQCGFSTQYRAPNGEQPKVFNEYIPERDGSKLFFNQADTTDLKGKPFRDGVIYFVNKMNTPPKKTIMDLIAEDPDYSDTLSKMRASGVGSDLSRHEGKITYLAPINHGWQTREKEASYSSGQNRKLMQLHTIPHQLSADDDGGIWRETQQKVPSSLPSGRGSNVPLTIKRHMNGHTYIGHDQLDEKEWALVLDKTKVATDGVLWKIDWPMKCPAGSC